MFDVLQICWWFLQVTLVGYLCVYRLLDDDNDRLLFAPIAGLAALFIVANVVWMWTFPTYLTSFLLACTLGVGAIFVFRFPPKPSFSFAAWLIVGVVLLALHGSLMPFAEKVFQAFPLDRIGYLSSYVLFQQHDLSFFTDAVARLGYNGDKQVMFMYPTVSAAFNEMQARTACGLTFISLSWLTPYDLHRLANAWEVFLRVIQFTSLYALFSKSLNHGDRGRGWAGPLALCAVFGFWFQYMKDYNSWPHLATLAFAVSIAALLVSIVNKAEATRKDRYLIYLLTLAMCINHPEFGAVLCLIFGIVILITEVLRRELVLHKYSVLEGAGLVAAIFIAHPYIISWMRRSFALSPIFTGPEYVIARPIYALFGNSMDVNKKSLQALTEPFALLKPVALGDMFIGTTGLSYVTYTGSAFALGAALLIIALMLRGRQGSLTKEIRYGQTTLRLSGVGAIAAVGVLLIVVGWFWPLALKFKIVDTLASVLLGGALFCIAVYCAATSKNPGHRILVALPVLFFGFYFGSLLAYHWFGILGPGSAYRSLPYWSIFASSAFWILLVSSEIRFKWVATAGLAALNLIFAVSIFWVSNNGGMETYPPFYTLHSAVLHTEKPTVRDKYDFDYLDLVEQLGRCNLVFLDFQGTESRGVSRFQAANLMIMLDNLRVRYVLGFPYLNAYQLLGDAYSPGFKKEDVHADCVVDQEMRNGRLSYRLTETRWQ